MILLIFLFFGCVLTKSLETKDEYMKYMPIKGSYSLFFVRIKYSLYQWMPCELSCGRKYCTLFFVGLSLSGGVSGWKTTGLQILLMIIHDMQTYHLWLTNATLSRVKQTTKLALSFTGDVPKTNYNQLFLSPSILDKNAMLMFYPQITRTPNVPRHVVVL